MALPLRPAEEEEGGEVGWRSPTTALPVAQGSRYHTVRSVGGRRRGDGDEDRVEDPRVVPESRPPVGPGPLVRVAGTLHEGVSVRLRRGEEAQGGVSGDSPQAEGAERGDGAANPAPKSQRQHLVLGRALSQAKQGTCRSRPPSPAPQDD